MHRYIIKRLLMLIPVLLSVAFIIFAIMDVAEGDPVYSVVSADASEEEIQAAREEMGLTGSLFERYFNYVKGMLHGDLGTSYVSKRDVMETYLTRLPNTLKLASVTMIVALGISIPLGIVAAVNQNSIKDTVSMILALLGLSMPNFWLGLLLIIVFSLKLGWFPSGGYEDGILSIVLPAFTIGAGLAAFMTRSTRSSMLDVIRQDYLRMARAKGVPERKVIRKHALRNALIPIITVFGVQFSNVLGGSVLAETVFAWPGVGRLVVDAIDQRDIPTVTGALVMTTMLVTVVNLLIDIVYAYVDPRMQIAIYEVRAGPWKKKEELLKKYKKRSTFMSIWHQLRKNKGAIMGLVLLVVIIVVALGSPYPFDYETQVIANNIKERMQPPSAEHWFGTDDMGRDIFARVCYGARYSLAVGIIAVMFALVFGVTLGAAAGYIGGVFEDVTMRVCDIFSSIPSVLMAIAVVSALGKSTFNLMLAVGIASTAPFVRVARAAVLTIRGEEYIESARAIGVPEWQIVATHILPNCVSQIIVQATLRVGSAIISAAQLSFLGLGVPAPAPEWGSMLSAGRAYIRDYSYMTLYPGLAIMVTVLSLNLIGDGLRDALDPKLKR